MQATPLPTRTTPKNGTFAFNEVQEKRIYDALRGIGEPKMSYIQVAAACDVSLPTLYAIEKRVEARLAKEDAPLALHAAGADA